MRMGHCLELWPWVVVAVVRSARGEVGVGIGNVEESHGPGDEGRHGWACGRVGFRCRSGSWQGACHHGNRGVSHPARVPRLVFGAGRDSVEAAWYHRHGELHG